MSIGDLIKKYRKSKNINQDELGDMVEVSRVTITRYENGTRTPDLETLVKIADALNIPTSYLLDNNVNSFSTDILNKIYDAYNIKHRETNNGGKTIYVNGTDVVCNELDLDWDIFEGNLIDNQVELPIDIQKKLFEYLSELNTDAFLEFCSEKLEYINLIKEMKETYLAIKLKTLGIMTSGSGIDKDNITQKYIKGLLNQGRTLEGISEETHLTLERLMTILNEPEKTTINEIITLGKHSKLNDEYIGKWILQDSFVNAIWNNKNNNLQTNLLKKYFLNEPIDEEEFLLGITGEDQDFIKSIYSTLMKNEEQDKIASPSSELEDWTDEEKTLISEFKEFLLMKRKKK